MKYSLMHKNVVVADIELDEVSAAIVKIVKLHNQEHLPVAVSAKKGVVNRSELNEWWYDRSIPASRSGVRKALETMNISNPRLLLSRCFGLSLSDQYWIKPLESDIAWKDVNFFNNDFSEDIGDILFGKKLNKKTLDYNSPDNTSDGFLKKRWKIINGKRCLLKSGSAPFMQQPFNEVIASKIMERLGISHIPYSVFLDEDGEPYSVCEDFITEDTELISAWRIMQSRKQDNNTSKYQHYVNCCEELGIKKICQSLNEMIVVDYIIANEDRHFNNFGLIRNADTLEFISPAPIFDSGSSLGYDKVAGQILSGKNIQCKPFKKTHEQQLALVTSFDWIDFSKLNGVEEDIREVFRSAGEYMDDARIDAITKSVNQRIAHLYDIAQAFTQVNDDITEDTTEDIAEDYTQFQQM